MDNVKALERMKFNLGIERDVYAQLFGNNVPPPLTESQEAETLAIAALEKQVAKPISKSTREGYLLPDYCCPTCGDLLPVNFGRSRVKYCDQCGQRLAF